MAATGCMTEDAFAGKDDDPGFSDPSAPCGRWPNGAPRPCDTPPSDDDGGNYNDGEGCDDGYDDDDWYDDDGENYECYGPADCSIGEKCVAGYCEPESIPTIPECNDSLVVSSPIPVPDGEGDIVALSAVDVDDDGQMELVVERFDGVSLVKDAGETVALVALPGSPQGFSVVGGRYDKSSADDLVAIERANGNVYMLRNDGNGGFMSANFVGASDFTGPATPGDFNGDGNLDLLLGNVRWAGAGGGTLLAGAPIDDLAVDGSRSAYQADDDASLEVVGVDDYSDATIRWDSNGGTSDLGELTPDAQAVFATADYDLDGYDDVLRLAGYGNSLMLTRILSAGGQSNHRTAGGGAVMASSDFHGDGMPEAVLFDGSVEGPVYVFRNIDDNALCRSTLGVQGRAAAVGDFTGDGLDDLALSVGASVSIYAID
jgi:hypothetical protein